MLIRAAVEALLVGGPAVVDGRVERRVGAADVDRGVALTLTRGLDKATAADFCEETEGRGLRDGRAASG